MAVVVTYPTVTNSPANPLDIDNQLMLSTIDHLSFSPGELYSSPASCFKHTGQFSLDLKLNRINLSSKQLKNQFKGHQSRCGSLSNWTNSSPVYQSRRSVSAVPNSGLALAHAQSAHSSQERTRSVKPRGVFAAAFVENRRSHTVQVYRPRAITCPSPSAVVDLQSIGPFRKPADHELKNRNSLSGVIKGLLQRHLLKKLGRKHVSQPISGLDPWETVTVSQISDDKTVSQSCAATHTSHPFTLSLDSFLLTRTYILARVEGVLGAWYRSVAALYSKIKLIERLALHAHLDRSHGQTNQAVSSQRPHNLNTDDPSVPASSAMLYTSSIGRNSRPGIGGADDNDDAQDGDDVLRPDYLHLLPTTSTSAIWNCVYWHDPDPLPDCATKKKYVSQNTVHHQRHGLFVCTICWKRFQTLDEREAHTQAGGCPRLCIHGGLFGPGHSTNCPNYGTTNGSCRHRGDVMDTVYKWVKLYRIAHHLGLYDRVELPDGLDVSLDPSGSTAIPITRSASQHGRPILIGAAFDGATSVPDLSVAHGPHQHAMLPQATESTVQMPGDFTDVPLPSMNQEADAAAGYTTITKSLRAFLLMLWRQCRHEVPAWSDVHARFYESLMSDQHPDTGPFFLITPVSIYRDLVHFMHAIIINPAQRTQDTWQDLRGMMLANFSSQELQDPSEQAPWRVEEDLTTRPQPTSLSRLPSRNPLIAPGMSMPPPELPFQNMDESNHSLAGSSRENDISTAYTASQDTSVYTPIQSLDIYGPLQAVPTMIQHVSAPLEQPVFQDADFSFDPPDLSQQMPGGDISMLSNPVLTHQQPPVINAPNATTYQHYLSSGFPMPNLNVRALFNETSYSLNPQAQQAQTTIGTSMRRRSGTEHPGPGPIRMVRSRSSVLQDHPYKQNFTHERLNAQQRSQAAQRLMTQHQFGEDDTDINRSG